DHAAGLSGLDAPLAQEDLYDWDKITGLLAAQAPWWTPGTATGYHAVTQGFLIGELVRRISGKSIGRFFNDEIAVPLGADFFIGVPESAFSRIGDLVPPEDGETIAVPSGDSIASRTFRNPSVSALQSRTREWRVAEIPAANGHGNARSVARAHSPLACGGAAFGVRLFGEDTAGTVMVERISGTDHVLGAPMRFGLGFGINSEQVPISPNENACYWGGWGGSLALIDQDARMSAAFVMNKMGDGTLGDMRAGNLLGATYAVLGK
ncbi:MAG TPA: serine hydrolase domain-containing protein, partial [Pseudomonadales bacterium]|nr:serine hydrolase domain-containing protein [Pseudomonadales bacterium]